MTASRVVLQVDLQALAANYAAISAHVAPLKVMPVLKANAYGLGVRPIARALQQAGAAAFGVAELKEAEAIVDLGCPVHILGALLESEIQGVVEHGIVAPITDLRTAQLLSAAAVAARCRVSAHCLIDSGMGRLGMPVRDAFGVITEISRLPNLDLTGLYSHFPHAYGDIPFSNRQVQLVVDLVERLAATGITFRELHMANSDGINNVPASCTAPFTMVRTGINLYGVHDVEGERAFALQPALRLTARLAAVRVLPAGTTIGYGCQYILNRTMPIGTVAIGYADGVPMSLSRKGSMTVRGVPCRIVGRVSMDYTTIDLSGVPDAQPGDEVVCIGDGALSVRDWAAACRSIPYQIIASIGSRVAREYRQPT